MSEDDGPEECAISIDDIDLSKSKQPCVLEM